MRRCLVLILLVASVAVHANDTLRVGNQVLSAGDSAGRVIDVLGKPSSKSHARQPSSSRSNSRRRSGTVKTGSGERWNYRRDGHYITVTLTDDRVSSIEDRTR
jgi:hypothetical protein